MVRVHPYQACIPTLDEVARKLTLLTTSHENWAYTFVRFNEDAQHVPLPKEGHLSAMIEGMPSRKCMWVSPSIRITFTLTVRVPSGLPRGAEQGPKTGSNISIRVSCPWDEYAQ